MHERKLGRKGLPVSALGLGCMGMSEFYGPRNDAESLTTLQRAVELGVTFWDTADIYGPHSNERLLGRAFAETPGLRQQITLATKFGILRDDEGAFVGVSGRPEYVREACEQSLQRLGTDTIDLYFQHRVDPTVPIEETVGAMAELVQAGKVRYLGLSEAGSDTLERANKVHQITALQSEYSLWSRELEGDILPTCRRLGIGLVAYSPLGRGFLTGAIQRPEDLAEDDWRRTNPRFTGDNFAKNIELVEHIQQLAKAKGCTPAQLALAWVLAQGDDIVPIPGTRSAQRLAENWAALEVSLTAQERESIERTFPTDAAAGTRYPEAAMTLLNG